MTTKTKSNIAIITRNYLNNLKGYAVRKLGEAKAEFKEIFVVKNAQEETTRSNESKYSVESSFGCGIVIVGEKSNKKKVPANAVRVHFSYDGFYTDKADHVIKAKEMYFTPKGVFAVL